MLSGRVGAWLLSIAVAACLPAAGTDNKSPKLPQPKIEAGDPPSKGGPRGSSKDEARLKQDAVKYHIKNLKDKDVEVRQNSAYILGQLGAAEAVPALIEALKDEHILVQMSAHGALNKITGKNFGYKNYPEWKQWWVGNKDDFVKKKATGPARFEEVRAPASNTQGLLFLSNGDYQQAYRMFLDAVNADPRVPDYRNNLGLAVMELARENPLRYIDAITYFEEALGLDENLPQPYMNIGSCYARMGKHIEAQSWFRRAIDKDKRGILWEHCWTLGKDLLMRGDFHLALEYLEQGRIKAERNRKYDPRVYRDLALAYYGLDMYHSAYREIVNLQALGYDANPEFVQKVRKALTDQGVDPDKEDAKAREEAKNTYGAVNPSAPPPNPKPEKLPK
jgi:tetratricopeptide (TPR) repeat protein